MFRILVCDDDREIVHAIELYLSEEGYEVLCAYDGMEAAEVVRRENVHLLIVDIMMPRMDGITMTMKLRHTGNHTDSQIFNDSHHLPDSQNRG